MPENKQKLINLRIDLPLFKQYKAFCTAKNSNVSSELRYFIRQELGLIDTVKTVKRDDFRDSLNGSIHGRDPLW